MKEKKHHPLNCGICLKELGKELAARRIQDSSRLNQARASAGGCNCVECQRGRQRRLTQTGKGAMESLFSEVLAAPPLDIRKLSSGNYNDTIFRDYLNRVRLEEGLSVGVKAHPVQIGGAMGSTRMLAPELEVESDSPSAKRRGTANILPLLDKWGSAANGDAYGDGGFEIQSSPASGYNYISQMRDYSKAFAEDGCYVTTNNGGHIHVDTRDFCYMDIIQLLLVFQGVKRGLRQMLPEYRASYLSLLYPVKSKLEKLVEVKDPAEAPEALKTFFRWTEGRNEPSRDEVLFYNCRVSDSQFGRPGLNTSSWFWRGSVECRFVPGMILLEDMLGWGRLMARMFDFAKTARRELVISMMEKGEDSAEGALENLMMIAARSPKTQWFIQNQAAQANERWAAIRGKEPRSIELPKVAIEPEKFGLSLVFLPRALGSRAGRRV